MDAAPQFFICYDRTYRAGALQLRNRLQEMLRGKFGREIEVFIDQESIESGDWRSQIDNALAAAYVLVVLVNDALITRAECRREFQEIEGRIKRGDSCNIITVRFQHDSEIYQKSDEPESRLLKADAAYLDSLKPEERAFVLALRAKQYKVDGSALAESDPETGEYKAALRELADEVAKQYRRLSRLRPQDTPQALEGQTSPKRAPGKRAQSGLAMLATSSIIVFLCIFVLSEFVFPSTMGWVQAIFAPEAPPQKPPKPEPDWHPASVAVLTNETNTAALAYYKPDSSAEVADIIAPGVDRPQKGDSSKIRVARINDELWYEYLLSDKTPAYVTAKSLGLPEISGK